MAHLVEVILGTGNHVTFQRSTSVRLGNLQCVESEHVAMGACAKVLGLCAPAQFQLSRKNLLCHFRIYDLVDISSIAGKSITYNGKTLSLNGLEHCEERVLLFGFFLSLGIDLVALGQLSTERRCDCSSINSSCVSSSNLVGSD